MFGIHLKITYCEFIFLTNKDFYKHKIKLPDNYKMFRHNTPPPIIPVEWEGARGGGREFGGTNTFSQCYKFLPFSTRLKIYRGGGVQPTSVTFIDHEYRILNISFVIPVFSISIGLHNVLPWSYHRILHCFLRKRYSS